MTAQERAYRDWYKVYHYEVWEKVQCWGDRKLGSQWAYVDKSEEETE